MPDTPITHLPSPHAPEIPGANGSSGRGPAGPRPARGKPKVKKLRLFFILCGLMTLAGISTVFGMMMAVASDLPSLENTAEYQAAQNSVLQDDSGAELARLTGNQNRILVGESEISPMIKNAVISVEDRRFYEHNGVDFVGIARALWADITRGQAQQGASTITQQFVKNALAAQGDRSIFQKLRESALAYHLERQWTKQKIITQYLNTVYFGNGAYGVESAMRTYFGTIDPAAGEDYLSTDRLSRTATPAQAALLAAMIASPSGYDPLQNPGAAKARRDMVLGNMYQQGFITEAEYRSGVATTLPTRDDVTPPVLDSQQPYFTTWVTQQLVDRYGAGAIFGGGLTIKTTLDTTLQDAAQSAITNDLGGVGPSASLVAIDNGTGEVRAIVGGDDYNTRPFNLATNGHRQPGSAIKPFTLIAALENGATPEDVYTSEEKTLPDPNTKGGFEVHNYEGSYMGPTTLRNALIHSDNSIFAELGVNTGTKKIAALAQRMGIRTPLSTNPAMTLGGLKEGLTPLEMAFAYATIGNGGVRRSGTLASPAYRMGPVAIQGVYGPPSPDDSTNPYSNPVDVNERREARVYPDSTGSTALDILRGVVSEGTGTAASVSDTSWGKTGTTENYGDAWFCGGVSDIGMTACVWVGYPDGQQPMKTEYNGEPVAGGTYPAVIWHDFMTAAVDEHDQQVADKEAKQVVDPSQPPPAPKPVPKAETVPEPQEEAGLKKAVDPTGDTPPPAGKDGGSSGGVDDSFLQR
ncbi:MAG: penicillin-binding protein [Thermoleophilaceae bacterium]|nr:penicillin-binding protein [Thermoleophilaceae bacterium]